MIITPEAREQLLKFLQDCDESFIRVGRQALGGGCSVKLSLGVTLDEDFDEEDDLKLDIDGLPVVIDKNLAEAMERARISFEEGKGVVVSIDAK